KFDRGYISPYFVTTPERMEASLEEPYILITDQTLSSMSDLLPVLEKILQGGNKDVLVVAEDVTGEALTALAVNRLRGTLNAIAATKAAADEGIVPGGGIALINATEQLDKLKLEGDEAVGVRALRRALEEPLRQIVENAGFEGSVVLGEVRRQQQLQENDNIG